MLGSESRGAKHPVLGDAGHPEEGFPCPTPTAQRQVPLGFPAALVLILPHASEAPCLACLSPASSSGSLPFVLNIYPASLLQTIV